MESNVRWTSAPDTGFWRIGRSPDPIRFSPPPEPEALNSATAGNRFDSPTHSYSVCYFATELAGCFGETLARFRPDPGLASVASEEGFMLSGEVPADWRYRRLAVRAAPESNGTPPRFLDVENLATRETLRDELGELLAFFGYTDLDVAVVRGADRRITRWVGAWAYDQRDEQGAPVYAGVRYL
jgi:RES domain